MATSLENELKEICQIYTRLTSLLIELGYEVFVDRMDNMNEIECIESTMRVLELIDEICEDTRNGSKRAVQGHPKVPVRINSSQLKELIKESLEESIKEQSAPKVQKNQQSRLQTYKDSLDELLAGLASLEPPKKLESPKIDNAKLMQFVQKSKAWRARTFQNADVGKKWKTQPPKQFNYFYDDTAAGAPSTSAKHNTSINVENLNLEI